MQETQEMHVGSLGQKDTLKEEMVYIYTLSCERQYSSCGQVSYIIRENPIIQEDNYPGWVFRSFLIPLREFLAFLLHF